MERFRRRSLLIGRARARPAPGNDELELDRYGTVSGGQVAASPAANWNNSFPDNPW
jgi:hypothetical protein